LKYDYTAGRPNAMMTTIMENQ